MTSVERKFLFMETNRSPKQHKEINWSPSLVSSRIILSIISTWISAFVCSNSFNRHFLSLCSTEDLPVVEGHRMLACIGLSHVNSLGFPERNQIKLIKKDTLIKFILFLAARYKSRPNHL